MHPAEGSPDETRLLSSFLTRMGGQNGYLVRIYPVVIGEGIIGLPQSRLVIGRDSDCSLVLADLDVSRRHASIELREGEYVVTDMGSTNGTLVNDKRVEKASLASGDLIRVGKTILKFLRGEGIEKQYYETVYQMMINDGLTGIPNKRFLVESIQRELFRSQRHHRPLSLAVVDIDHFKTINDTYGHLAGDAVLRELSGRVKKSIRKDELFARYGGEEFVILLPESNIEQAKGLAERIRAMVADESFVIGGTKIPVTISIGVSHTDGDDEITPEDLFLAADRKLYEAKTGGRNRVM